MTNALTVYDQFDELQRAAIALQESGYFSDVKSKAQAIVKVMAGAELGLPPFASMTGIHIIQGKPVLGANVLATLVKNDPRYDYRIYQSTDNECALNWYEGGKEVGMSSFTIEEAKDAGLTGKDNWKKYPSDMLFARAISRGARRFAPGIFGGSPVYTPDEMGADVDEEGNVVIESVIVDANPTPESGLPEQPELLPDNGKMSLESAMKVTNRDGELYHELPTDKLSFMANALMKSLEGDDLSDEVIEERQYKLDAIEVLLANR